MKKTLIIISILLFVVLAYFSPQIFQKRISTEEFLKEHQKDSSLDGDSYSDQGTVTLKWKINPEQIIGFKTVFEQIGTENINLNFGIENKEATKGFKQIIEERSKEFEKASLITTMQLNNRGNIETKLFVKNANSENAIQKNASLKGVQLRGEINEHGKIESFYLKNDQKNLLAIFFELPDVPAKIGDTWSLKINLLETDQSFICETAKKINTVELVDILLVDTDTIVVLRYEIMESIEGYLFNPMNHTKGDISMRISFDAISQFSLKYGRWKEFNGILQDVRTGYVNINSRQLLSLIPIDNYSEKENKVD